VPGDFYARVARLEEDGGCRVGGAASPSEEPVRFVPSVSLAFAPSDTRPLDGREMVTAFLGLSGSGGALPPFMLDELAEEDERPVRRALLTPFHHRAVSLLHRSVFRCRVPDSTCSIADPWPTRLATIVSSGADDDETRELALMLAPLLFGRPSARSLARALPIVSSRFLGGAPASLRQRTGLRLKVAASNRSRLSSTRLGDDAMLGSTIEDPGHRASIVVGPLEPGTARMLASDGAAHRAIARVVAWLAPADTVIDLEVLHAPDARAALGKGALGRTALGRAGRSRTERITLVGATAETPVDGT
jgi:predicted component of type VI protein secretion system